MQEPVPGTELKGLQHRGIVGQGQRIEHIAALLMSQHQRVLKKLLIGYSSADIVVAVDGAEPVVLLATHDGRGQVVEGAEVCDLPSGVAQYEAGDDARPGQQDVAQLLQREDLVQLAPVGQRYNTLLIIRLRIYMYVNM